MTTPSGVSADRPPHLWLASPAGFLCLLCQSWWQHAVPYGPCHGAPPWVPDVIRAGEALAGITLAALYDGAGQ